MKLIVRFSPVIAAFALAMACGDDDNAPSAPVNCKSPYADRTAAELKVQTTTTGKCAADTAAVCANEVIKETSDCAQTCFAMHPDPGDEALRGSCTLTCLQALSPAPSDGCLSCYVASVGCTAKFCLMECLGAGAADLTCTNCRLESGCTAEFYACSGLPLPLGAATGGTSGNGSGGAVSTGGTGGLGEAGMTTAGVGATSGAGGVPGEGAGGGGGAGPAGGGAPNNAGAGG